MPKKVTPKGKAATPPKVEAPKAPKKTAAKKPRKKAAAATEERPEKIYIRNGHRMEIRLTLTTGRRIELKPLGERGDMVFLSEDEIGDANIDTGLVNYVREADARAIMDRQSTNQQTPHAALDALRNPHGEVYDTPVVTTVPFEQQGSTVAQINHESQRQQALRLQQQQAGVGQADVSEALNPPVAQVPGSVGHPATNLPEIPAHIPPEQQADWLARQKNTNPIDHLRGNVRVNPAQEYHG